MKCMSAEAAGAYLRLLRNQQGLTQTALAERLKVAGNTIWRIEAGQQQPGGDLLAALLSLLKGSSEYYHTLLQDKQATKDDAARYAKMAQSMTDEELERAVDLFRRLRNDPRALERWLGYGEGLADDVD